MKKKFSPKLNLINPISSLQLNLKKENQKPFFSEIQKKLEQLLPKKPNKKKSKKSQIKVSPKNQIAEAPNFITTKDKELLKTLLIRGKNKIIKAIKKRKITTQTPQIESQIQTNLKYQLLSIDSRILPLFRTPLIKAKIVEITTPDQNNIEKENISNQILKNYLKVLIVYNSNLKSYISQVNNLNLILKIKTDNIYQYILKFQIFNFIKQVNKVIYGFDDNFATLIWRKKNKNKKRKIPQILKLLQQKPLRTTKTKKSKTKSPITIIKNKKSDTLFINTIKLNNEKNKQGKIIKLLRLFKKKRSIFIHKIPTELLNFEINTFKSLNELGNNIIKDLDFQIFKTKILIRFLKKQYKVQNFVQNILSNYLEFKLNKKTNTNKYQNIDNEILDKPKLNKYYKNLLLVKMLTINLVNKTNLIKIEHTLKSLIKNPEFHFKTDSISIKSNPISIHYYKNNNTLNDNNTSDLMTPILNQYLQIMSKYNLINKNINIYYSNIIGFKFNNSNNKLFINIYKLLAYSFKSMYCLISKPVFIMTSNKIIIQLFYYLFIPNILKNKKFFNMIKKKKRKNLRFYLMWKKRKRKIFRLTRKFRKLNIINRINLRKLYFYPISEIFPNKFKFLCEILSNLFKKSVEFNLIRLHYPYYDSNILANFLAFFINRIKLRIIAKKLFGKAVIKNKLNYNNNKLNIIPTFLSGFNIKVAGRLLNKRIIPRKTVKTIRSGAVSKSKINYLDVARYTNKNKRGAYSITVSSGQKFF